MPNLIPKSTDRITWLRGRHRSDDGELVLTASDAAALHGEHRYKTRIQLFQEKSAPEPVVTEESEAMERGNRLEPTIRQWAGDRLDERLVEPRYLYLIEGTPCLLATIDAVDEYSYENQITPPRRVVEIKTTTDYWNGRLPRTWYWQGVHQSICTLSPLITWAIFDGNQQLHIYEQHISDEERAEHWGAVTDFRFWWSIGEPNPEWPASYEDVSSVYPEASDRAADLSDYSHLFTELADVQFQIKELSSIESELKGKIASLLGDANVGTVNGTTAVTWKNQSRSSLDTKGLAADHPDLVAKYTKQNSYRVMRVKGDK